jgi:hypothetical protein
MALYSPDATDRFFVPPDWLSLGELDGKGYAVVAVRTAGASEPSSYAFMTSSATAVGTFWHSMVFRGVDHIENLNTTVLTTSNNMLALPQLRTTTPGALVAAFVVNDCTSSPPVQTLGTDGQWTIVDYVQSVPSAGAAVALSCMDADMRAPLFQIALAPR